MSHLSRRAFMVAGASGGLVLGLNLPASTKFAHAAAATSEPLVPNAFVRIAADNTVTVIAKHIEMGQGTHTGLATVLAEELDASWEQITVESAPADAERYNNLDWGPFQGTGGSSAMHNSWTQMRTAGASARAMFVNAAANAWDVTASEISVTNGVLIHGGSGNVATFGELLEAAAAEPVPENPPLKTPAQFKLIGKAGSRIDTAAKSNGTAVYTQDVQLPDGHVAVIARPDRFGGKVASFDATEALEVRDVHKVVEVPRGVAVVASSTWAAIKGRKALKVEWDDSAAETRSSDTIMSEYRALAAQRGQSARADGDVDGAMATATQRLSMDFEFPFLAHAPMEPLNAVARVGESSVEIWTGSQLQTGDVYAAAGTAGVDPANVVIHTLFAGGSFGRRATPDSDMVSEAVSVAKAVGDGHPVKVVWTREDDIRGGRYRPMYFHRLEAGLDEQGKIIAWDQRIVGQSIVKGTPFEGGLVINSVDQTSVEGASTIPYAIDNLAVSLHTTDVGVPPLWWRAVGATHTAYAVETAMDVLAQAAESDPVEFRMNLLEGHPRHLAAMALAAEKANWGDPVPEGIGRGVALHESFNTVVAQVVDVRLDDAGKVKVEKVVCAVECGTAINPDQIVAQMEGGIGYGLGAALRNALTLTDGRVDQSNFHDYQPTRLTDMPEIEVHIVESDAHPTGVGEPGLPPIAPAVANAIASLTGERVTRLPFSESGLA